MPSKYAQLFAEIDVISVGALPESMPHKCKFWSQRVESRCSRWGWVCT